MTQSVIDLQSDLVKIRQSYAEVMATQKKMEKQKVAAEGMHSNRIVFKA
jgi:phage shock protein A